MEKYQCHTKIPCIREVTFSTGGTFAWRNNFSTGRVQTMIWTSILEKYCDIWEYYDFLEFKNQIKRRGWILTALTTQNTTNHCCVRGLVATSSSPPQWSSAAQAGQSNTCDSDKKKLLHSPIPKGLHNGNSSLLLNLVLPNCFVCFGPRLRIRNDKSASFKLKARQLQCQCQHDRVLVATGGEEGKEGQERALHFMLGK